MNVTVLCEAIVTTSEETINEIINTSAVNGISGFVSNDIVMTIVTTVVGIAAGFACSMKNRFWRNFTIIVSAIVFNVFMLLRVIFISESWLYLLFSFILWTVLSVFGIFFLREKEIVSRKKIGKMIEKFTSTANPNKDVCIFAGDIDFFGEVFEKSEPNSTTISTKKKLLKKLKRKHRERLRDRANIENNSQFKQLKDAKFRRICILCVKPLPLKENIKDDYHKDRIRIGYIKEILGERVHFKFFNDDCDNCFFYEQNNCALQSCPNHCPTSSQQSCTCPKNNNLFSHPSLPDTTLRGRIVTNRETDAKCVAITTKRSSRKDYILRQYGSGEKESSLYNVIWKVWWKMCEEDNDFIKECVKEYNESKKDDIEG